ncbi:MULTISPECIES: nodulation protein NolB [unclassified Xanthobacter]|uniref:nodulation protein NolB n=1 Tax=unclassified Xanthobacter TaxID=2623496 RepID=UPI001F26BAD2|nr:MULTISPECIES: nodulation protein NolB [unclassified Xanthobacter]
MSEITYLTRKGECPPTAVRFDDKGKPYCAIDLACPLCGGSGRTSWTPDPVCIACDGEGISGRAEKVALYTPDEITRLNAALAEKRARQDAERARSLQALEDTHGPILEAARAIRTASPYADRILNTIERTASLSPAQAASLERAVAEHQDAGPSQHLGAVGDRIATTATVASITPLKPRFRSKGRTTACAVTLATDDGHQLVAFTATPCSPGDRFTISGTVKQHKTWKGKKQTIIKNTKIAAVK